jgi:pyruvate/2-oxoglutarate dehydrogenase complex dihydrolipoamide dehydrogenase (E3) component
MERDSFAAAVIGSGQAGTPLAKELARSGRKTILIEREHVGGSCVNFGCTPTKTLVASARVAHLARRAQDFGVQTDKVEVDLPAALTRANEIVRGFREGSQASLKKTNGLELIFGEARFVGAREVQVGERRIRADWVFVNTGTRPAVPPIEGLAESGFLDNKTILQLDELPKRLLVLGGGYIGLEYGQMFRRFGSEVAVLERSERLLEQEDEDVSEAVHGFLEDEGIELKLGFEAARVEGARGSVRVSQIGGGRPLEGSHVLLSAGRAPNTDALQLEAAGIETDDRGYIRVNDRLETSAEGVWALGDVKGGPAFTHISYDDYRIVRMNLLEGGKATTRDRPVPYTMFTDPQLGRVGLREKEATQNGREVEVYKLGMDRVARAIESRETKGFLKVLAEKGSGKLLGCAILGSEGGEMMSMIQLAMAGGLKVSDLREGVFAHPLYAEAFNNLFS